jgi:pimeloyl-ACP methyl ester carboxylesterase
VLLAGGEVEVAEWPPAPGRESAAPLVLLHEGLGSLELWRDLPEVLSARTGRRTVVWSRHGYGHSSVVSEPRRPSYMHDEAQRVLPELLGILRIFNPVLVGHSDGASIALIHAGDGRWPVAGVVAVAPHVVVEPRSIAGIAAARRRYLETDMRRRMARYHRDPDATFWGWNDIWLSPAFRDWSIEGILPGMTAPVLAVQATDDAYGTLEQLDRIEAAVNGPFRRLVLADGGHAPFVTHPDEVLDAVVGWLAELG